jgi:ABC-type transport system substrate-binding protein
LIIAYTSRPDTNVMMNVYDQLTTRDWSSGTMKIVPKLAESFSQSQTDPKTWRFNLRKGLTFINGDQWARFNKNRIAGIVRGRSFFQKPR